MANTGKTKPPTGKTETTKTKPPMDISLGIVIDVGGKVIPLRPKTAITEIKTKGLEVGLPPGTRVELGTVENDLDKLIEQFDSNWGKEYGTSTHPWNSQNKEEKSIIKQKLLDAKLPNEFTDVLEKILEATLAIEAFHFKVPSDGTQLETSKKQYTFGLSLTWEPTEELMFAGVGLRGIYLTISNEGISIQG